MKTVFLCFDYGTEWQRSPTLVPHHHQFPSCMSKRCTRAWSAAHTTLTIPQQLCFLLYLHQLGLLKDIFSFLILLAFLKSSLLNNQMTTIRKASPRQQDVSTGAVVGLYKRGLCSHISIPALCCKRCSRCLLQYASPS